MVKFLYDHLPAPDPATPTVAAPAPMNLAAVSISLFWTETESGLKIFCWKIIQNIEILYLKTETYRTAVRVASLGAERTTRFMFNFWINLYLLFEIKYKKKFYNEIENIIFLFFLNVFFFSFVVVCKTRLSSPATHKAKGVGEWTNQRPLPSKMSETIWRIFRQPIAI